MARDLPEALETEIAAQVLRPFAALFIDLPDPVRVWSGVTPIEFIDADGDMQTWEPGAGLGQIEALGEATDGTATGMKVTMFNIPEEFREDIADQAEKGGRFEVYVGALSEDYQTVVAVKLITKHRVDNYKIRDAGATLEVEVSGESRAIDQKRPAIKRFTAEWQRRHHADDAFFDYVSQMTEINILWAKAEQKTAVISGGGFGGFQGGGGGGGRFNQLQ